MRLNALEPERECAEILISSRQPWARRAGRWVRSYEFPGNRPGTLESYSTTADGRAFYVVTKNDRTLVITVVEV